MSQLLINILFRVLHLKAKSFETDSIDVETDSTAFRLLSLLYKLIYLIINLFNIFT